MGQASSRERQILLAALLFSSLTGIMIWYLRRFPVDSFGEWFSTTAVWISYFTNLTNALVVVMAAALLYGRGRLYQWFNRPPVQAAFCLYIAFVGLAYWGLLANTENLRTFLDWWPEMTAHTLSPILGVVYWVRAVPKGALAGRHPFLWLVYPIGYLVYWLIRGPLVGYYPYFFIDVNSQGYGGVALWSGILILAFVALGTVMWQLDRRHKLWAQAARETSSSS